MTQLEIIKELTEIMEHAIKVGDWKVDDACDLDMLLSEAADMLKTAGYMRDGITGETWIDGR
jgi:3-keto-L-gulonate-6-phosphate decarboxylase